jgi:hypothetical protein
MADDKTQPGQEPMTTTEQPEEPNWIEPRLIDAPLITPLVEPERE